MKRNMFLMSFGIGATFLAANHVDAQTQYCAPHKTIVERLAVQYGESLQSIGLGHNNAVIEIFAAPDTGSWTITITQPGEHTCLVASGQAFQHVANAAPNTDQDA